MGKSINPKKNNATDPVTDTEKKFDAAIYKPFKAAILESLKGRKKHLERKQRN